MAFKVLLKRFKVLKVRRNAITNKERTQRRKTWMGISHGFHMVERESAVDGSIHAQREQVEGSEFWLFGAFDKQISSGITKYLQSHLFGQNLTESRIRRKAKDVTKKAYLSAKANIHEEEKSNDTVGSSTVLVMNNERFVAAYFGGYRVVACKDGMATQIGMKHQRKAARKWRISDLLQMKCASGGGEWKLHKSSRLIVTTQKVEAETEFIILASDGVWEVMRNQEAVDLVSHIEDAQKAAECLAEEAITRMSKSTISVIVVRFH